MQVYLENAVTGLRHELGDFCVLGRGKSANLKLDHGGVSREHASIRRQGQDYLLTDLGSSNGTYVNGLPVAMNGRMLRSGDEIQVGTERFRFENSEHPREITETDSTIVTIISPAMKKTERVTLLVGDIKGYTKLSAEIGPMELSERVSVWCDRCRAVIQGHGGMVEKFIGDCVFAWWRGSDLEVRTHALAVARELSGPPGTPDGLCCGVGLHVGEVALSRTGHNQYTLLGSEVNLAFRIESLTRDLKVPVLASVQFVAGMKDLATHFRSHGARECKGIELPVEVFSLVD
jgi:adenylate cyclase